MTQQELIASLTAIQGADAVYLDDGQYLDWSSRDGGKYIFEAGGDCDPAQLTLTREDLLRLHAALTLTLLRDGE